MSGTRPWIDVFSTRAETETCLFLSSFRERAKPKPDPAFDSLFLPTTLAHRFFWSYCTILHPVWPILDLEEVRRSIAAAYAGGVTYGISPQVTPSETARQLATARNLIVLALGARIEGGDGDAHCPKDVAKNWALVLAERSKAILLQHGLVSVSVEASKLWLLHSLDMTNHGYADGEWRGIMSTSTLMLETDLVRSSSRILHGCRQFCSTNARFGSTQRSHFQPTRSGESRLSNDLLVMFRDGKVRISLDG